MVDLASYYGDHLNKFFKGNKSAYATAIMQGEKSGTLSDPGAAYAFKANNPQMFGQLTKASPYASFKAPKYNPLSQADALKRAQDRLNPMYQQSRTNTGVVNQQQANLLRQRMNQKGDLTGGGIDQGNINLAAGLQQALANLDTGYSAQSQELADSYIDRDMAERARRVQEAMQEWQTNRGAYESDRAYQYGVDRDAIGDARYADETQYSRGIDARDWNRTKVLDNREAAVQNAGLTGYYIDPKTGKPVPTFDREKFNTETTLTKQSLARKSSGGGGGGGGSNQAATFTKSQTRGTDSYVYDIDEAIKDGVPVSAIEEMLEQDMSDLIKKGYDIDRIRRIIGKYKEQPAKPQQKPQLQVPTKTGGYITVPSGDIKQGNPFWYFPAGLR